ncbi:MAG: DUF3289 family protein [Citrobacter koseri]|nr:DUF3289 family protein [Citrobacter koseri]
MSNDMYLLMSLPREIFATSHRFEDYHIDDMQYGPISRQHCADILFDEMKELSAQFAKGLYSPIIGELIDHFHYGNGQPWFGELLNRAYEEVIRGVGTNDMLMKIRDEINKQLHSKRDARLDDFFFVRLKSEMQDSKLPKFNRYIDRVNGLGVSVHDIYTQQIKLVRFQRYAMSWEGLLSFKGQDHFGLGKEDITNTLYKNFRFFRIWFFLQRHRDYAYRPFLTNLNAHAHIKGSV